MNARASKRNFVVMRQSVAAAAHRRSNSSVGGRAFHSETTSQAALDGAKPTGKVSGRAPCPPARPMTLRTPHATLLPQGCPEGPAALRKACAYQRQHRYSPTSRPAAHGSQRHRLARLTELREPCRAGLPTHQKPARTSGRTRKACRVTAWPAAYIASTFSALTPLLARNGRTSPDRHGRRTSTHGKVDATAPSNPFIPTRWGEANSMHQPLPAKSAQAPADPLQGALDIQQVSPERVEFPYRQRPDLLEPHVRTSTIQTMLMQGSHEHEILGGAADSLSPSPTTAPR